MNLENRTIFQGNNLHLTLQGVPELKETPCFLSENNVNVAEKTKKIAELCWYYDAWNLRHRVWYYGGRKRDPQGLALHLNISETEIYDIMETDEYLAAVENLMLTTRSPADIEKWIENYPRSEMPSKFGKRMGLSEEVVPELIEKVLDRLSSGE